MTATVVGIADEVETAIQTGTYAEPVIVQRLWTPRIRQQDVQAGRRPLLTVIPSRLSQKRGSRGNDWIPEIGIDVGLRAFCPDLDTSRADALAALLEDIRDHITNTADTAFTMWPLIAADIDPLFDLETLQSKSLFASVLRLGFGIPSKGAG